VLPDNNSTEIAKQAKCARKQLRTTYRLEILVQEEWVIIVDMMGVNIYQWKWVYEYRCGEVKKKK